MQSIKCTIEVEVLVASHDESPCILCSFRSSVGCPSNLCFGRLTPYASYLKIRGFEAKVKKSKKE